MAVGLKVVNRATASMRYLVLVCIPIGPGSNTLSVCSANGTHEVSVGLKEVSQSYCICEAPGCAEYHRGRYNRGGGMRVSGIGMGYRLTAHIPLHT